MFDQIMTWLLRIVCYGVQIGVPLLIAAAVVYFLPKKSKKVSALLFAVIFAVECMGIAFLAYHPIVSVPEAYRAYVTEEEEMKIASFNKGFYSANIPIFPVCIQVIHADEWETVVKTQYLFWGTTEMSITTDGPSIVKPLV